MSRSKNPLDVAWLPQPVRPADGGRSPQDGRRKLAASPTSSPAQRGRVTVTSSLQSTQSRAVVSGAAADKQGPHTGERKPMSCSKNPLDVARLPQPVRPTDDGRSAQDGRRKPAAMRSPGGMAAQRGRVTVTTPCQSPDSRSAVPGAKRGPQAGEQKPISCSKNPLDVARLPQPVRLSDSGHSPQVGRCRRATLSPEHMAAQSGRMTVTTPLQSPHDKAIAPGAAADKPGPQRAERKPSTPSRDVVRPALSNPFVVPPIPKPPPQSPRRSASSSSDSSACRLGARRSERSVDEQLRDRLRYLKLRAEDISRNKDIVNDLCTSIRDELIQCSPARDWKKMNSGSYYEKTKVQHH